MSDQKGTLRIYKVKQRNGKLSNRKQRTNIPKQTVGKEKKKLFTQSEIISCIEFTHLFTPSRLVVNSFKAVFFIMVLNHG